MSRYAVIDVGTNSVKFHIGERAADGSWRTVVDRAEVTRLGEGLDDSGRLEPEPIGGRPTRSPGWSRRRGRTRGGDRRRRHRRDAHRLEQRGADRRRARADRRRDRGDPGEEEARLAFLAVKAALGQTTGSLVVFDTGGGSSQFTFGHDDQVDERFSVNVGAVRFTEQYGLDGAVGEDVVAQAQAGIAAGLELDGRPAPDQLVGMGGAVTNIAAVKHELETYDPAVIQGTVLTAAEVDRQIELYRMRSADERREIVGCNPTEPR